MREYIKSSQIPDEEKLDSEDTFVLAGQNYKSRLLVGTGIYGSHDLLFDCLRLAECELVYVAIRRVGTAEDRSYALPPITTLGDYTLVANTSGCSTTVEALRVAQLAREIPFHSNLIKLEITNDRTNLGPDVETTLAAARELVSEGFDVLACTDTNKDNASRLQDAGVAAVMPLGSLIGSGIGVGQPDLIQEIVNLLDVPVILSGGIGNASDVTVAMELGVDAVALNTAIACASDPRKMASAIKHASIAGRHSFLAGRMHQRPKASPSSPPADR